MNQNLSVSPKKKIQDQNSFNRPRSSRDDDVSNRSISIQDQASDLIQKYSKGSFQNTSAASKNSSGQPSRINKALAGKKPKKLTMKQMRSVEKLTQGISTHTRSQKLIEIDFTDDISDNARGRNDSINNIEMMQPDIVKSQTSKNSETTSNSFQRKAQLQKAQGNTSPDKPLGSSFKNPYLKMNEEKQKKYTTRSIQEEEEEEKVENIPGSYKRKVTLNSFNIDDILLPSVTNKILNKSPQNKILGMQKTSVKHSPINTPRNNKDDFAQLKQTPVSSVKTRKSTMKANRRSIQQEASSPQMVFGGVRHSPVRSSLLVHNEPPRVDELIEGTPHRSNIVHIATEQPSDRQRSVSSPPAKSSPVKKGGREDSLQTVHYEQIKTELEKNNLQSVQQIAKYKQDSSRKASIKVQEPVNVQPRIQPYNNRYSQPLSSEQDQEEMVFEKSKQQEPIAVEVKVFADFSSQVDFTVQDTEANLHKFQADMDKKNQTIVEYERLLQQLTQQCESQTSKCSELQIKNGNLQVKLSQQESQNSTLEEKVKKQEKLILEKDDIILGFKTTIEDLNKEIQKKSDDFISQKQKSIYHLEKINQLEEDLAFQKKLYGIAQSDLEKKQLEAEEEKEKNPISDEQINRLKEQNQMLENQLQKINQDFQSQLLIEHEIRTKNEQIQNQMRQVEFVNSQKDEEIITMRRHLEGAQRDMKSLAWLESQMKQELQQVQKKRIETEDISQQLKQQLLAQSIFQRQKEMEVESLVRENRTLQGSLQMVQQTIMESVNEIQRLNEVISNNDRGNFSLRNQCEQFQREGQRLYDENQRIKNMLDQEKRERDEFENKNRQLDSEIFDFQSQIRELQGTIRELNQEKRNWQNQREKDTWQSQNNTWQSQKGGSVKTQKQVAWVQPESDEEQEQQEQESNPFEAYRRNKSQAQKEEPSNIPWLSLPRAKSVQRINDQATTAYGGWKDKGQDSSRALSSERFKQRDSNLEYNETNTFAKKKKSAAHHQMFDSSQAPWGVEKPPQSSQGGQIAWSSLAGGQQDSNRSSSRRAAREEMPAAGGISPAKGGGRARDPQPWAITNKSHIGIGIKSASELQKELSEQMQEKERLEQEFWRLGNKSKTKVQIQKKQEVEEELDLKLQSIQSIKQRLRDMGQLR